MKHILVICIFCLLFVSCEKRTPDELVGTYVYTYGKPAEVHMYKGSWESKEYIFYKDGTKVSITYQKGLRGWYVHELDIVNNYYIER